MFPVLLALLCPPAGPSGEGSGAGGGLMPGKLWVPAAGVLVDTVLRQNVPVGTPNPIGFGAWWESEAPCVLTCRGLSWWRASYACMLWAGRLGEGRGPASVSSC